MLKFTVRVFNSACPLSGWISDVWADKAKKEKASKKSRIFSW